MPQAGEEGETVLQRGTHIVDLFAPKVRVKRQRERSGRDGFADGKVSGFEAEAPAVVRLQVDAWEVGRTSDAVVPQVR